VGRIIAIDYGRKRVGLAVTDPLRIIATGLETVPSAQTIAYLHDYLSRNVVDTFLVGYPKQMNNEFSDAVQFIDPFIAKLKKEFPDVPVVLADERFTSKIAMRTMIEGGMKKTDRRDKAMVDKISAVIMLQSYLVFNNQKFE
jgi:putative holliday junction resolvase